MTLPLQPPNARRRVVLGAVLPVLGHALVLGAALLAARLVTPSPGGGFEDLGAAVAMLLGGELLLAVFCVGTAVWFLVRNQRPLGFAIAGGWLVGAFLAALVVGVLGR